MFETRLVTGADSQVLLGLREDLEQCIPFFSRDMLAHRSYLLAIDAQGAVVGMACFTDKSFRVPGAIGLSFISTHSKYLHRGVAKSLVAALFAYALSENKAIANTGYEPDGERWLKPLMQAQARLCPQVTLIER